ncbi:MAG: AraC family transcriptional regulator [Bacteroidetes bacterium]|nr:AraC family transcriptional regulator [Bacteroidota bacterium]
MDVLSNILETIKLHGVVYRKMILLSPWAVDTPTGPYVQFWRLIKGECVISIDGQQPIDMQVGDLVMMPLSAPYRISCRQPGRVAHMSDYIRSRQNGSPLFSEGEEETVLLGGHFEFEHKPVHPLIGGLPPYIHISGFSGREHIWLQQTADLIFSELNSDKQGSKILVARLAEALFIHTIRAYIVQNAQATGFLAALSDERINTALKQMQDNPEREWTLELLSKTAGMSRTLFFNRFKETVGETPAEYLTNRRIDRAKRLLVSTGDSIRDIAQSVGYQSEAAFSRLFKSRVQETPARYRRVRLQAV